MCKAVALTIVSLLLAISFIGLAHAQLPDGYGTDYDPSDYGVYISQIDFGVMKPGSSQTFDITVSFSGSSFVLTGVKSQEISNYLTPPTLPITLAGEDGKVALNLQIPSNAMDYKYTGTIQFIGRDPFNDNVVTSVPFTLTVSEHPSVSPQATLNTVFLVVAGAVALAAVSVVVLTLYRRR